MPRHKAPGNSKPKRFKARPAPRGNPTSSFSVLKRIVDAPIAADLAQVESGFRVRLCFLYRERMLRLCVRLRGCCYAVCAHPTVLLNAAAFVDTPQASVFDAFSGGLIGRVVVQADAHLQTVRQLITMFVAKGIAPFYFMDENQDVLLRERERSVKASTVLHPPKAGATLPVFKIVFAANVEVVPDGNGSAGDAASTDDGAAGVGADNGDADNGDADTVKGGTGTDADTKGGADDDNSGGGGDSAAVAAGIGGGSGAESGDAGHGGAAGAAGDRESYDAGSGEGL
jgi:hypothetical protein